MPYLFWLSVGFGCGVYVERYEVIEGFVRGLFGL